MPSNFYTEFTRGVLSRPLDALVAMYWYVTRRRLRGRNLLRRITSPLPYAYQAWIRKVERLGEMKRTAPTVIQGWQFEPHFTFLVFGSDAEAVAKLLRSAQAQWYSSWDVLLVLEDQAAAIELPAPNMAVLSVPDLNSPDAFRAAVCAAKGDFIVPAAAALIWSASALFRFAEAIQTAPNAQIFYGDQDRADRRGRRCDPWFKSRWNREMFLAQDYLSSACAISTSLARDVLDSDPETRVRSVYSLLLEACERSAQQPVHIPHLVSHLPWLPAIDDVAARVEAVSGHLGSSGAVVAHGPFGSIQVRWPLPDELPLVTIIVPTRDKVELLSACIDSLRNLTEYPNYEILIIDNNSTEESAKAYLGKICDDISTSVIEFNEEYNFSAINNFAAQRARGAYLCLLNNDTEIVQGDWLTEMMRYAIQDHVGAVGAKLLYGDGTIQHAGVVIGLGGAAGHAHRSLGRNDRGYFGRAHIPHFVSAVTAACLVISKAKFFDVGGFDEHKLKVAFNDVDLCLKLEQAGFHNVYAAQAVVCHHESKSRGNDLSRKNVDRYRSELRTLQQRWGTLTYADPLHSPNLDRSNESYVIGW